MQALNPEKALNCYGNAKVMTILVSLAEKTFKLIHWKRLSDQIVNLGNNFSYPLMLSRVLNKLYSDQSETTNFKTWIQSKHGFDAIDSSANEILSKLFFWIVISESVSEKRCA